jgi:hypothetical protein
VESALTDHDLITLRVIGEWWELDLTGADKKACVQALAERLQQVDMELELNYLPPEEASAMQALVGSGGRMPVGTFTRRFGEVRQMGPGRLEREEPWLDPASAAEALWYRGFLYRAYDNADDGTLVEFFYVPEELYAQLPAPEQEAAVPEQAPSVLPAVEPPLSSEAPPTHAVDDVTTMLASAQRNGLQRAQLSALAPYLYEATAARNDLLLTLAVEMGLLRENGGALRPSRDAVAWLKQEREPQLQALAEAWSGTSWNELCHTPGLRCEGSGWSNEPLLARTTLLDALPRDRSWYRVDDLVGYIRSETPDFQRPEGNYDTWYIRDVEEDVYLRGFENWDKVEGRLLRFLLHGPMSWLGLVELDEGRFRLAERALQWLSNNAPESGEVNVPLVVQPNATVLVPYNASRYQRFQVARIAEAQPLQQPQPYEYRLTPDSLSQAQEAGIRPERVLEFLEEASGRTIPASVRRAVERWSEKGLEGRLQPVVILRVRDSKILDTLQTNARTRPYLGERLGELAAVVQEDKWRELQQVTAELGLLLDVTVDAP